MALDHSNGGNLEQLALKGLNGFCLAGRLAKIYWQTGVCVEMHSLGAYHDGQGNDCLSTDQYIMAKAPTELDYDNFLHPYQFSRCSITYFRGYLNQLNTYYQTNCLL